MSHATKVNLNVRKLREGDQIRVTLADPRMVDGTPTQVQHVLTVWRIGDAGEGGSAYYHGPDIYAHIAPGRWGIAFDESGCAGIAAIDEVDPSAIVNTPTLSTTSPLDAHREL